jgi:hypothetical protein
MALLSAYATATEYRARTGDATTGTNATLDAQLLGISRLLEKALRVAPGAFNEVTASARIFPAYGGSRLWLRDSSGFGYFLQDIDDDGLGIDSERDNTFDGYVLDFDDVWLKGMPENAAAHSEPYTSLELVLVGSYTISQWPTQEASVRITGKWGWATVPDLVVELVCHRTHELREALKEGGTGSLPAFAAGDVPMRPSTAWLWKEAEALYGRWIPAIA